MSKKHDSQIDGIVELGDDALDSIVGGASTLPTSSEYGHMADVRGGQMGHERKGGAEYKADLHDRNLDSWAAKNTTEAHKHNFQGY